MDCLNVQKIDNGFILKTNWRYKDNVWDQYEKEHFVTQFFPTMDAVLKHFKDTHVEIEKTLWENTTHRITELQKRIERLEEDKK